MWKKAMWVVTAGMWILALGQLFFVDKIDSMRARQEVFHTIGAEPGSYEVQMMGAYEDGFLTREEEKVCLAQWGEELDLSLEKITFSDVEDGHVTYSNIEGDGVAGYCKIITKEEQISSQAYHCTQYVSYYLTSAGEFADMQQLRNRLHEFAKEKQIDSVPVLVAEYESLNSMTQKEQTSLVDSLAESLNGTIVSRGTDETNYFAYGYSKDLSYSQNIDGKDMNFLIYMKPSDSGKTVIHLQFPMVSLT